MSPHRTSPARVRFAALSIVWIMKARVAFAQVALWLLVILAGCDPSAAPIAVLTAPIVTGEAPLDVAFDLSRTAHPLGRAMSFQLDFGDGSAPITGTQFDPAIHHTYEADGAYEAVLLVADDLGTIRAGRLAITVDASDAPIGTEVGESAPDFASTTTDGQPFALSGLRGSVVLLDFWGAWCPPCRASLPHLDALATTYGDRGAVIVLMSTDFDGGESSAFLAANGFGRFVGLWEPGGKAGNPVAQLYGVSGPGVGIPRTYLIDRQGVIRYVGHPLELPPEHIEALL